MTIKNNKLRPARLATLIAFAFTGISQELYASDSFNTALVELDNPGRREHTTWILFLMTS